MNAPGIQAANYVLRFFLEIAAFLAVGYWGFHVGANTAVHLLLGIGVPALLAALWGVFRIPNDGGRPVIEVAPRIRLLVEAVVFIAAIGLLYAAGRSTWATILLIVVIAHYAIGYERTLALLANRPPPPMPAAFRPRDR